VFHYSCEPYKAARASGAQAGRQGNSFSFIRNSSKNIDNKTQRLTPLFSAGELT
jgi:hypothetical protein